MILLDTHVWWWSLTEPENLSGTAFETIAQAKTDHRAIASISIWELAMMVEKKRIELKVSVSRFFQKAIHDTGIEVIELSPEVAVESCRLPGDFQKDPADRIIVATARIHNFSLLTKDKKILDYPYVKAIW